MKTQRLENAVDLTSVDPAHVQACLELVAEKGFVSFTSLITLLEERGVATEGIAVLTREGKPNTLFWEALSFEAYAVLRLVLQSPEVEIWPTGDGQYWNDARCPKRLPGPSIKFYKEKDFGRLTWMPVLLRHRGFWKRADD